MLATLDHDGLRQLLAQPPTWNTMVVLSAVVPPQRHTPINVPRVAVRKCRDTHAVRTASEVFGRPRAVTRVIKFAFMFFRAPDDSPLCLPICRTTPLPYAPDSALVESARKCKRNNNTQFCCCFSTYILMHMYIRRRPVALRDIWL